MKENNASRTKFGPDYKLLSRLFFRLLPYQILLIVVNAVNSIVDSLFASNTLGIDSMNAIGLFAPMNHFLYALSMMLVSGSMMLYGKHICKDPEKVKNVYTVDILMSVIASVLTSVVLIICAFTNAISMMEANGIRQEMFNQYLLGQSIGIPALVLGQQMFAFLSLENKTKRTMAASISCFVSNAAMNYLFLLAIPMGTFGLGLASSVSEWIFFIIQAVYFISGRSQLRFSFKYVKRSVAPEIIKRGYPGALSRFVEMFRCIVVNSLIMMCVGSVGISSFAASNSFLGIIWAIPFGITAVARMLFSISIGREDRRSMTDTMRIVIRKGVPLMCVISFILILAAEPLTRLFYQDATHAVYDMTVMGFRMLPACMPLAVISLAFASYAQAAQKKALSIVLPIVDGFAGVSLLSLFLIPAMQMNGLYLANILNGAICMAVIAGFAWKSLGRRPKNTEDLLAMPEDFGVSKDESMDITVRTIGEVVTISRQVAAFCRARGIDTKRAQYSALALEEMAGNIVLHGFNKDRRKNHSVDISVIHKGDELILNLRDDCRPFDPNDRFTLLSEEDKVRNVGIRLAFMIARDVQYQNILGLNVLTMNM